MTLTPHRLDFLPPCNAFSPYSLTRWYQQALMRNKKCWLLLCLQEEWKCRLGLFKFSGVFWLKSLTSKYQPVICGSTWVLVLRHNKLKFSVLLLFAQWVIDVATTNKHLLNLQNWSFAQSFENVLWILWDYIIWPQVCICSPILIND